MTQTKTLQMTFTDSNDKKNTLTIANAKDGLTETAVRDAMGKISSAKVFAKEGVDMYHNIVSAQYVERNTTSIFDDSKALSSKQG